MNGKEKIKIFCSYCHEDEKAREKFDKHINMLVENGIIESWNDTKITPGANLENQINQNLIDADIVLPLLSVNFLNSENCKKEIKKAKAEGKKIIPVIINLCPWEEFTFEDGDKLGGLKALPKDAKSISQWEDQDEAWNNVYEELKRVCEAENFIRKIKLKDEFKNNLDDCSTLEFSHSKKNILTLSDIFVWPEFEKATDPDNSKSASEKDLFKDIDDSSRIWIVGEDQSGKTALAKNIFLELRKKNLIPVLFSDPYQGLLRNQLKKKLSEQYVDLIDDSNYKDNMILIFDDFHKYNNQSNLLADLKDSGFKHILLTDKIFSFNFRDKNLINLKGSYCRYEVIEFYATKRNELIRKWLSIDENKEKNDNFKSIDEYTETIDSTLGKAFDGGIVPSYPFFILSIISTNETFRGVLDQNITSQGHCYQALIYQHFKKNDLGKDIDAYLNFLYELAYFLWKKEKDMREISEQDLKGFIEKDYKKRYTPPLQTDTLIRKLETIDILTKSGLGYYSFHYKYFFYYFVAKYIADNLQNNTEEIKKIFNHLHKNENAYIAIFICHHSKDERILDYIGLNANKPFENYLPATLDKDEVTFIDRINGKIAPQIALAAANHSKWERQKDLEERTKQERSRSNKAQTSQDEDTQDVLLIELRRCIKTAEVMGHIIKNRWGSLEKNRIKSIFKDAMNIHLRTLSSFFACLKDEEQFLEEYLVEKIQEQSKKQKHNLSQKETMKIAKEISAALIFGVILGIVEKIVFSLGTDKLQEIIREICNEINTPASLLVKRGIFMQYLKQLNVEEIDKESKNFSGTAKLILKYMIVHHCRFHDIYYKDKQRIKQKLGISIIPNPNNK